VLLHHIVRFVRALREQGLDVTTADAEAFVHAIDLVSVRRRYDVKHAGRAILARRREHLEAYDRIFDAFWTAASPNAPIRMGEIVRHSVYPPGTVHVVGNAGDSDPQFEIDRGVPDKRRTWSSLDVLRRKDFAELTPQELEQLRSVIQHEIVRLPMRRTRRTIHDRHGVMTDMRRTMRRSLRYGGEVLALERRTRRRRARPLVLLCDISGSMEPYSRVLLQFVAAITRTTDRVEAFAFGTRLTRLTLHLRGGNLDRGLQLAAAAIVDWAGGTRIGESLKTFNFEWGRRVLGRGAVVLLISDGWDRGDITLLSREMARLRRSCHRMIWLNPLAGAPDYEPLARGMQAALPHVDDLLPVHNLESLTQLASRLKDLKELRTKDLRT
jgi:uncharacterized protein